MFTIKNSVTIVSPFKAIIDDCRNLVLSLKNVSIHFVKLYGNRAADCLARLSNSYPDCIANGGFVPSELQAILEANLIQVMRIYLFL